MTSRERVLKAVSFQVPDRVPIDLGGMKASGIAASSCSAAIACIPPAAAGEPTAVQGVTASERRKAGARLLAMNPTTSRVHPGRVQYGCGTEG